LHDVCHDEWDSWNPRTQRTVAERANVTQSEIGRVCKVTVLVIRHMKFSRIILFAKKNVKENQDKYDMTETRTPPIFMHIPRTGGKTLHNYFTRHRFRVQYMHFPVHFNNDRLICVMESVGTQFITILRNPVERHMSDWLKYGYMILESNFNETYQEIFRENNITDLKSYLDCPLTHNAQTKFLLGHSHYSKEHVTKEDADIILKKIEDGVIMPILFEDLVGNFDNMQIQGDKTDKSNLDASLFEPCNVVDTYLYDTVVQKYYDKTHLGRNIFLNESFWKGS